MSGLAQRRLEDKERRRIEIVDAADDLARDLGWDNVTVDGVAKRARLSRALVYLYFKDKSDLHAALWDRANADLYQRFSTAISAHSELCRFETIGRAYVRFAQEQPHYFEAIARFEGSHRDDGSTGGGSATAMACRSDVQELIISALREGQERGIVRRDCGDLALTAVSLWAFTHGLIQISTAHGAHLAERGMTQEAILEQAFAMLRRTLMSPDSQ